MEARWILSFVLIILTRKRAVAAHECTSSESVACRQEIKDLQEDRDRYYYATDNQALEELCRKQILAVNCINSFARECLTQNEQAYFKTLVLGSDTFLDTLCIEDSNLRKRYLKHSSCFRNITTKLDECTQHYRVSQDILDASVSDSKILLEKTCCIYFENIQCSSNATEQFCGKEAAELVSDLWTLLSGTYLTESCQPFSKYDPGSCTLYSNSIKLVPNTSLWTFILILLWTLQLLKHES